MAPPISGVLIAESLLSGSSIDVPELRVRKISRAEAGDVTIGQPLTWTVIEFDVDEDQVDKLTASLSDALDPALGWYCDFRSSNQTFVVFASRVFCYARGEAGGRAEAEAYGRSMGVPEAQLDWPE
jgi:hypothetical protein